ncbi:MAG: 8-oxoguanine DNA glycosylase [Defluviitaleaceae bacterium]|nr:8-oxoguanine DNA glycosylase [Defluviitaleaceae bacterium]
MFYKEQDNKIIMKDVKSFDIAQTLECGQCFRFYKIDTNLYTIVANKKVLYVKQENTALTLYPCNINEFESFWIRYFDFERDYCEIKKIISEGDKILQEAINFAPGIRILNQEPFECLISFIISQNNRITMIKKIIENLSRTFGEKIEDEYHSFPSPEKLNAATIDEMMVCKTGFRAKYIKDACFKITNQNLILDNLFQLEESAAREELLTIHGVGQKVADCVLLFSLQKHGAFPTDVWIKRVMEEFYFQGKPTSVKKIHEFALNKWGNYSGFAQQYLFNYAKEKEIGKK